MSEAGLLLGGVVVLVAGAELLVRGASRLAAALGIAPLVIGLTVVAYGTSAPELAVSLLAAADGQPDIALGNVIGSNIFNVLLILGLAAAIAPLRVSRQLVRSEVPLMIAVSALMLLLALDRQIGRLEGVLLLAAAVTYTAVLVRKGRREGAGLEFTEDVAAQPGGATPPADGASSVRWWAHLLLILGGLALLVLGARWLVEAATAIARAFGVSELVIGLTIVAGGTSLPELATSIMATLRGQRDIAVGNIVGSNIFNILVILGVSAALNDITVAPAALRFDIPLMLAVAVACLPVFFTGAVIGRYEGLMFLLYYGAYVLYLLLSSTGHDALPAYSRIMLLFVMPLTFVTLAVAAARYARQQRERGGDVP